MIINSPDPTYTVTEFDFTLDSNNILQLTIDHRHDTITFGDKAIVVEFGEKEKNGRTLSAEKVTILHPHVITYAERTRTLVEKSKDEVEEWKEFLNSKTIN